MVMTKENIVEKVDEFLIEDFEVEEEALVPDANLKDALDLDSLDFVDLVVAVESNFGVKLTGEDFVNIHTLQNFYDLIERKLD
jgi:acyl carrier protein